MDLLIEKHAKLTGGFEIKSVSRVTGAHLSGLRSFHQEYTHVPLPVIALVNNTYRLEDVLVMPWQLYLEKINEYL